MRSNLLVVAIAALVGVPFWLASGHQAVGTVPEAYRNEAAAEVTQWEVSFGTKDGERGGLGPLSLHQQVDKQQLDLLGPPADGIEMDGVRVSQYASASHGNARGMAYYGLGLYLVKIDNDIEKVASDLPDLLSGLIIGRIVLGNRWAMSAEDPLVKACPFKLPYGIKFGMGIEAVDRCLGDLVPREINTRGSMWYFQRSGGLTVELPFATFHYMHDQLGAVDIG